MRLDESPQYGWVEELRAARAGREQVRRNRLRYLRGEPPVERAVEEPDLALVDDLVGQQAARRLLEQVLGAETADLEVGRDAGAVLDDLVVEEGDAHLERAGHRGAIEVLEHVVDERESAVEVEGGGQRIVGEAFGGCRDEPGHALGSFEGTAPNELAHEAWLDLAVNGEPARERIAGGHDCEATPVHAAVRGNAFHSRP